MKSKRVGVLVVVAVGVLGGGVASAHAGGGASGLDEARAQYAFTETQRASAVVSEAEAVAAAVAQRAGTPSDAHLQDEGDGLRWEVKTDDGRGVREIQVDARTGAVVSDQADE